MINILHFYQNFRVIYNTTIFKLYNFEIIFFRGLDFTDKDDTIRKTLYNSTYFQQYVITNTNLQDLINLTWCVKSTLSITITVGHTVLNVKFSLFHVAYFTETIISLKYCCREGNGARTEGTRGRKLRNLITYHLLISRCFWNISLRVLYVLRLFFFVDAYR